jgi:hypothetical protein
MTSDTASPIPETLRQFHDSKLVGLKFEPQKSITLEFEVLGGQPKRITCTGVASFFCTGMLEGNIVDSIEVVSAKDLQNDDLTYFVGREGRGQASEQLGKVIRAKDLKMLLIAPSYGAEVGCVCSSVQLFDKP